MTQLSGWGRYPTVASEVRVPATSTELSSLVTGTGIVARGNGRAYGDSAIGRNTTLNTRNLHRFLEFNEASGQLVCEAGVLLEEILETFLPRGWFPSVTPGTKYVSVGGMIAADVHGKNHHLHGSFANCVDWLDLVVSDGQIVRCSHDAESELFNWTLGGMGLTGVIVRAAIRLTRVESGWIKQKTIAAANLDEVFQSFEENASATYSVAWLDCLGSGRTLGRSLLMLGEHAEVSELGQAQQSDVFSMRKKKQMTVPVDVPSIVLNRYSISAFNEIYYRRGAKKSGTNLTAWSDYFYPLDSINQWNRIYGRNGFVQFQCVFPLDSSFKGLEALLRKIARFGSGSFLAVLKRFGTGRPYFSFPMLGYTLALDFPVNPTTLAWLSELDQLVIDFGGRFYLAKDGRMSRETLNSTDNRVEDFIRFRKEFGLSSTFASAQSARLGI